MKKRPLPYKRPDSPIYWGRDPNTGIRLSLKTDDRDTAQAVLDALYAEYKQRNMLALDTSRATPGPLFTVNG